MLIILGLANFFAAFFLEAEKVTLIEPSARAHLLVSMGASNVRIIPRQKDKGADVTATLSIAETFKFKLAVQAKHWEPEPPLGIEVVNTLVEGMEAEGANLGWVVTSGTIPEEVYDYAKGIDYPIELIDGEHLAALIVESGLKPF